MARPKSAGNCNLCGKSFSKSGMSRHLQSCREKERANRDRIPPPGHITEKGFHLAVEGLYSPEYWLHLDAARSQMLWELDKYLRDTWLECCGHLSLFRIGEAFHYRENREEWADIDDRDMDIALAQVLGPGMRLYHEYDFGDTTKLSLRVVWEGDVSVDTSGIRLLARNNPPALPCDGCGSAAAEICTECVWEGEGLLCGECVVQHACDDEMLLPVVNSPRVGQCGYTGPDYDLWAE